MKLANLGKVIIGCAVLPLFMSVNSYAGNSLENYCQENNGQMKKDVVVRMINLATPSSDMNIQFSDSDNIYVMALDDGIARLPLLKMMQTAYLLQQPLTVCVNNDGDYFLGAELSTN